MKLTRQLRSCITLPKVLGRTCALLRSELNFCCDALAERFVLLLLLSVWFFPAPVIAQANSTLFAPEETKRAFASQSYRVFGVREGIPQSTVFAVTKNRDGFVFIGTDDGLARFDGKRFESINLPFLADRRVNTLKTDRDGAIWIGTASHGLFLYRQEKLERIFLPSDIISVEAIEIDQNKVWLGTPQGLLRCIARRCERIALGQNIQVAELKIAQWREQKVLLVGSAYEGLYRISNPDAAQPKLDDFLLNKSSGLPNGAIRSIAQWGGKNGEDIWIGTGFGFVRWNDKILAIYDRKIGISSAVLDIAIRKKNNQSTLLIATFGDGLIELSNDGHWQRASVADGLPESFIYSLLVDQLGSAQERMWLGTASSGLVREEEDRWRVFSESQGLPHRVVVGVGEATWFDGETSIWVGTVAGARRLRDGLFQTFLPEQISARIVYDLISVGDDIWLGTDRGLWRWRRNGQVESYHLDNSDLPGMTVLALDFDPIHQAIWVGTTHGLALVAQGKMKSFDLQPSQDQSIRAITEFENGKKLVATSTGLFECGLDQCSKIDTPCARSNDFSSVSVREDLIWINSRDGIVLLQNGSEKLCRVWSTPILPRPLNFFLQPLDDQSVMVFGYRGVTRLEWLQGFSKDPAVRRYGFDDGLETVEFNRAAYLDGDKRIWAASANGLVMLPNLVENRAVKAAPLKWLSVRSTVNRKNLQDGAELNLKDANVQFSFALLDYRAEHRHQYRFELDGLGLGVNQFDGENVKQINRIPAGNYRAQVWARDASGIEHGPIEFKFRVLIPWWRHPLLLVTYGITLITIGLWIGRLRARALRRQANVLEIEVATRTRELATANEEMRRLSLTDSLTGMWNRRFLLECMPKTYVDLLVKAEHANQSAAVLVIDLDHFKKINDQYGHLIGDRVLQEFAKRLRTSSREGDWLIRWGGEEVLIVTFDLALKQLSHYVKQLLSGINTSKFVIEQNEIFVSCSIGACVCPLPNSSQLGLRFEDALALADEAVYAAKRSGRNCAVCVDFDAEGKQQYLASQQRFDWQVFRI